MNGRTGRVIVILVFALVYASLAASAPPAGKVYRVAVVTSGPGTLPVAFRDELRSLGYAPGRNVLIDEDSVPAPNDPLLDLNEELTGRQFDVIVTWGERATQAVRYATRRVPVVFVVAGDPVAMLFAATLDRPGGNMTGIALNTSALAAEQVRLLQVVVPSLSRLGVIWNSQERGPTQQFSAIQAVAHARGVDVLSLPAPMLDFEDTIRAASGRGLEALLVLSALDSPGERAALNRVASGQHLPSLFETRDFVQAGGLMSYGPSLEEAARVAADYVDRILKGAKAGDLPVTHPVKAELVINLGRAKDLRLTIPQSVLLQADAISE